MRVPGDKSISHRALIFGALAVGETRISGLLEGEDVINTAQGHARRWARRVERTGEGTWRVHGVGVGGFREPQAVLDFGNSGTGCRLVMGAVAGCPITATFDGDASLRKRPMRRILDPVELIGARTVSATDGGRLPITLAGARDPIPIVYRTPVPSAQIKSAVLLAGLAAPGETTVIESEASRDHTERLLDHFGAEVAVEADGAHGRKITLEGRARARAGAGRGAGRSVLGRLPDGGGADRAGLGGDSHRRHDQPAAHRADHARCARWAPTSRRSTCAATAARRWPISACGRSALRGVEVPAARAPSMIDEYPVLAVAASFAEGTTVMRGLKELRVEGIRSARRGRRRPAGERRRGRDRRRRPDRARPGPARAAAARS